ncbi:MAG: TRAP transporter small permease [Rhodospirillales bacterium]
MVELGRRLRAVLDTVYTGCGYLAAAFLLALLAIIALQILTRWTGHVFAGATDYAGYCMAAASFFAMAYTLNQGGHIRVHLVLSRLGRWRRFGELWCFAIGTALAGYFAYYAIRTTWWSHRLNDISQGQDATPLWIPQLAMAIGTSVLALALADHLVRILCGAMPDLGDETVDERPGDPGAGQ